MKCWVLSVTSVQSLASATETMITSRGLRGCSRALPSAIRRAQIKPARSIERKHAAGKQGHGRARKPLHEFTTLLPGRLVENAALDFCEGEGGDK